MALGIRKVQYAPSKPGPQPCTVVRKDFVLSPGQLELELTLDKQVATYMYILRSRYMTPVRRRCCGPRAERGAVRCRMQ